LFDGHAIYEVPYNTYLGTIVSATYTIQEWDIVIENLPALEEA
jgi:hypothetical protein